jgi:hypothetical protein
MPDDSAVNEKWFVLAVQVAARTLGSSDRGSYPEGVPYQDALRVAIADAYKAIDGAWEELQPDGG